MCRLLHEAAARERSERLGLEVTVYVDDMRAPYGWMIMCHMFADTSDQLHAMAARIGIARKWCQYAGTWKEHYDIALSKRKLAVEAGAVEITLREAADLWNKRRKDAAKRCG